MRTAVTFLLAMTRHDDRSRFGQLLRAHAVQAEEVAINHARHFV